MREVILQQALKLKTQVFVKFCFPRKQVAADPLRFRDPFKNVSMGDQKGRRKNSQHVMESIWKENDGWPMKQTSI